MRRASTSVLYVFLIALTCVSAVLGQARKPLTLDDLLQMKKAGFDEQTLVKAIEANGASVDTSAQGLLALKSAGLGEAVIRAALGAKTSERKLTEHSAVPNTVPDDIGVFGIVGGTLKAVPVEIVSLKSRGMLKAMATAGIAKANINGFVSGATSTFRLSTPVELILRTPDGTAPTEYQVLMLESEKGRREFTAGKSGLTGTSLGDVSKNAVEVKFERIDRNVYKAILPELKRGEYGVLAPGLNMTNLAAAGKMYTFSVAE